MSSGAAGAPFGDLVAAAAWFEAWLMDQALPLWWRAGADHRGGGFHEGLTQSGEPYRGLKRARVQSRQAYVYATAGAMGWSGPWGAAARHGLDFLLAHYRREDGLYARATQPDGSTADPTPLLYEQAFALLAMAALHAAGEVPGLPAQAADLARSLTALRHEAGGFVENVAPRFQANAHMHVLEAALAWEKIEAGGWRGLADEIAELALARFVDRKGGFLREAFDPAWRPAKGEAGRLVEPGHQFEWAWLLEQWGRARGREDAQSAAARLFQAGTRGVESRTGLTLNALWDDLSPRDEGSRLWPQTERLKAALILGRPADALQAAGALASFLDTPTPGVWRERRRAGGAFVEAHAPATSLYHIVCACRELIGSGVQPRS